MNRVFSSNFTYLECAKSAIEKFVEKAKHPRFIEHTKNHKFVLATYDEKMPLKAVESSQDILRALRTVKGHDQSNAGLGFSHLFDFLTELRSINSNDTPGLGRYPSDQEPTLIFWFTDSETFSNTNGVLDKINIPGSNAPGSEFYFEPFRWEQRLFTISMGNHRPELSALSEAMIGETWIAQSMVSLVQTIENCFQTKFPNVKPSSPIVNLSGVNVKVSFRQEITSSSEQEENLFLFTNNSLPTIFPIPESFLPEKYSKAGRGLEKFPKRYAQPRIIVSMKPEKIAIFPDFPCDRIQMAQSPTFDKLSKLPNNTMWLAYVEGSSSKHNGLHPDDAFGFFKMSTSSKSSFSGSVSFYLLPYSFKKLFPLLQGANPYIKSGKYPSTLKNSFTSYLQDVPSYYWPMINDGLSKCKLRSFWPLPVTKPQISDEIKNRYSDIKIMAKVALEKLNTCIAEAYQDNKRMKIEPNLFNIPVDDLEKQFKLLQAQINSSPVTANPNRRSHASQEELDFIHTVPMACMGEYTRKKREVFRDPFETEEDRINKERVLFGNPYARKKKDRKDRKVLESDTESQDSVMNEAEEEASHEFDKESAQVSAPKRRNLLQSKAAASLATLPRQPQLILPEYANLTWGQLDLFQFQYEDENVDIHVDMHVDSIVQELENEEETIKIGSFASDSTRPELLESSDSEPEMKLMDLDMVTEHDSPNGSQKLVLNVEVVSDDEEDEENEKVSCATKCWSEVKRDLYLAVSQWPKHFDLPLLKNLVSDEVVVPGNADISKERLMWALDLAIKFRVSDFSGFLRDRLSAV